MGSRGDHSQGVVQGAKGLYGHRVQPWSSSTPVVTPRAGPECHTHTSAMVTPPLPLFQRLATLSMRNFPS